MNMTMMKSNKQFNRVADIIDSLTINPNPDSVSVLEEIGTNSSIDEVREMFNTLVEKFPDKQVICLPKYYKLRELTEKKDLEFILNIYKESVKILEGLINE